jgi:hypothetical protein
MFLVDIKPYKKVLQVYKDGHGLPSDKSTLKAIMNIFHEHIYSVEYPDAKPKPVGCRPCVENAFNRILGKIEREGHQPIKLTPNIPPLEPVVTISQHEERTIETDIKVVNPEELKWGEFKTYCKAKGLNVKGKTKKQLLDELG